jgi:hypothetical protein
MVSFFELHTLTPLKTNSPLMEHLLGRFLYQKDRAEGREKVEFARGFELHSGDSWASAPF